MHVYLTDFHLFFLGDFIIDDRNLPILLLQINLYVEWLSLKKKKKKNLYQKTCVNFKSKTKDYLKILFSSIIYRIFYYRKTKISLSWMKRDYIVWESVF